MAFTVAELTNISNATLDFHLRGPAHSQVIQSRPLVDAMMKAKKTFPGGKEYITGQVKGVYTSALSGYTHDDTVTYNNPANIRQVQYPWYEEHAGIGITFTELKKGGITVDDTQDGSSVTRVTDAEKVQLTDLLEDKMEDLSEGVARSFDVQMHNDGTADPLSIAGIDLFLPEVNDVGVIGGIDRAVDTWWRHRARTSANGTANGTGATDATFGNLAVGLIARTMNSEFRQLRRYGGRPNLIIAGSDFLDIIGDELRDKGQYTDAGWQRKENTDLGMAEIYFKGLQFMYDPQLDDQGKAKFCYVMDTKHLHPRVMKGEDMKTHTPARPHDKYVMYRGVTWTGGLFMNQANCHGVYESV